MDETARKIYLAIDNNSDKEKSLEEIKTLVEEERGGLSITPRAKPQNMEEGDPWHTLP